MARVVCGHKERLSSKSILLGGNYVDSVELYTDLLRAAKIMEVGTGSIRCFTQKKMFFHVDFDQEIKR